jgi:hypothetical protein
MLIVKRRLGDTEVEIFEISEDQLKQYKTVSASGGLITCNKEAIDVYKMEYETCARRYNDLYTAAWTNFSYMALFAGGILTFGGSRFIVPVTALLSCLPLLFWWIATFEPLNKYGDQVQYDLGNIERAINALCFPKRDVLAETTKALGSNAVPSEYANKGLTHFQDFAKREMKQSSPQRESRESSLPGESEKSLVPRVRQVVRIAASILLVTAIYLGVQTARIYISGQRLTVPGPQAVVLEIKH